MPPLMHIEEPPRAPAQRSSFAALFALGFRPFYLLASGFAALSVALWALQFAGLLGGAYLAGPLWHAHEMLFGFALAVIVGFLFTAGRNWSNLPTPAGGALAALALLWLAARVLLLTPFATAAAVLNVAFPLAAAVGLGIPFFKARNQRNYFFVGLLVLLAVAAGFFHAAQLGVIEAPAWAGIRIALDVVLFIVAVMGGRVIPMFTNSGVPGADAQRHPWVEKASLGGVLVLLAVDAAGLTGWPVALVAAVAGVAHATRWALWQPWRTLRTPIVWILHGAYVWVPLHLLLRTAGELGWIAPTLATHALTVGAIGGLIIGMMTRTARGHTGRMLRADRFEVACYGMVLLSALVRVGVPLVAPAATVTAILVSALLWSAAFGVYAVRYWPILSRPRIDGRPG